MIADIDNTHDGSILVKNPALGTLMCMPLENRLLADHGQAFRCRFKERLPTILLWRYFGQEIGIQFTELAWTALVLIIPSVRR